MKKFVFATALLVVILCFSACGNSSAERFDWDNIYLNDVLPAPKSDLMDITHNGDDWLSVSICNTNEDEYYEYINQCKEWGFTVDSENIGTSFYSYNQEGYYLALSYYESKNEMHINLDIPILLSEYKWPVIAEENGIPQPKSKLGNIKWEYEDSFYLIVGNTTQDDFKEYIDECISSGYDVDFYKGDKTYYADNSDGYHINISYEGFNMISIRVDSPEDVQEEISSDFSNNEIENSDTSLSEEDGNNESASVEESSQESSDTLVDGMRPEFKEAMDSYEAFYDEYCDFMKKYKENPTDLELLAKYYDMLTKLAEMDKAFDAWEEEDLNDAELLYYIEVTNRISQKLLEASM